MKTRVVLLCLLLALSVQAETITVDSPSKSLSDIQAAIDRAKNGDTIVLLPGVYQGQQGEGLELFDKGITLRGQDPGDPLLVDATVVRFSTFIRGNGEPDQDCSLFGLTFSGGSRDPMIRGHHVQLTISRCVFSDNLGGGIDGFGLSLDVENTLFAHNVGWQGGGIALMDGELNARHCTFINNRAKGQGGAVYTHWSREHEYVNCLFVANHAEAMGGAIFSEYTSSFRNCTLAGNTARLAGGSLCVDEEASLSFVNTIVAHNQDAVAQGRSIVLVAPESDGRGGRSLQVMGQPGTIFRSAEALEAMATSLHSCLQKDSNEQVGPFAGTSGTVNEAPQFVRVPSDGGDGWGDNSGTPDVDEGANDDPGDLHLQKTSPCVDAGEPVSGFKTPVLDLDDNPRVMGARIDMGAYEYVMPSYRVTHPAGGETFSAGSEQAVTWDSKMSPGPVDLLISTDGGHTWQLLETALPDTGSYHWALSDQWASDTCVLRVVPSGSTSEVYVQDSGQFNIQIPTAGLETDSPWPSLGGDYSRSGLAHSSVVDGRSIVWVFDANAPVTAPVTVGTHGRIHIASGNGTVYTLDAEGRLLWSYETDAGLYSAPSVGPDGTVHVGDQQGRLHVIDPNGRLRWTFDTGGFVMASPAVAPDGTVFVGSQSGTLTALDSHGTRLWSFQTWAPFDLPGAILASPALSHDGSMVYVGGLFDPNLYALDTGTGEVQWTCRFTDSTDPNAIGRGGSFASPVVAQDGTVYQTLLGDTNLYAIDANSGSVLWAADMSVSLASEDDYVSTSGWSEPALGPDGTIYVASDDAYLRAVTPEGLVQWVTSLGTSRGFTLCVGREGLICAAGDDGTVIVVDANGDVVSQFEGNGRLSYPLITDTGQVIVADDTGKIWALH